MGIIGGAVPPGSPNFRPKNLFFHSRFQTWDPFVESPDNQRARKAVDVYIKDIKVSIVLHLTR